MSGTPGLTSRRPCSGRRATIAVGGRAHRQLHLHRFEDDQRVPLRTRSPGGDVDADDACRHRRGQRSLDGAGARRRPCRAATSNSYTSPSRNTQRVSPTPRPRRGRAVRGRRGLHRRRPLEPERLARHRRRLPVVRNRHAVLAIATAQDDRPVSHGQRPHRVSVAHGSTARGTRHRPALALTHGRAAAAATASAGTSRAASRSIEVLVDEAGVQIGPARKSGWSRSRTRNGMFVRMPSTGNARSAAIARAIAASRVSAETVSFASSGS